MSSLGFEHGFHPDTLWEHPDNAALRALRGDPNVLLEGDEVTIPDKRLREVQAATGKRHVFRRRAVPEVYRACLLDAEGQPRAGLRYRFSSGGATREGVTDAGGVLREWIVPDAPRAELVLLGEGGEERYVILLGELDPVTTLSGLQARLIGLGFPCGAVTGTLDRATATALAHFQRAQGLPDTGEPDDDTRAALQRAFGG